VGDVVMESELRKSLIKHQLVQFPVQEPLETSKPPFLYFPLVEQIV